MKRVLPFGMTKSPGVVTSGAFSIPNFGNGKAIIDTWVYLEYNKKSKINTEKRTFLVKRRHKPC